MAENLLETIYLFKILLKPVIRKMRKGFDKLTGRNANAKL